MNDLSFGGSVNTHGNLFRWIDESVSAPLAKSVLISLRPVTGCRLSQYRDFALGMVSHLQDSIRQSTYKELNNGDGYRAP